MSETKIRELKEDDIEECAEITISTFPWIEFGLKKENAKKFFKDRLGKKLVFVAEQKGTITGFITIKKEILFANYIRRIVVREDMRSKGIGSKLMRFVEEMTFASGLPNVFLLTTTSNEQAIKFYEANGYQKIGRIPDFIRKGMDEFIFWKTKGPVNEFKLYD
ncbi:MAG: GNAT family N-acetyltransferase [Candidatus Heimdallarchaeota archaeon]|nr:MAG: GNAT family N-acetyltransferase [Candidatus Heimdallarchaeota archaeon]